jgi:hypothetical protein
LSLKILTERFVPTGSSLGSCRLERGVRNDRQERK